MGERPGFWIAFFTLLAALSLGVVMLVCTVIGAHASTGPQVIDIQDDPGGNVGEYYKRYNGISKAGAVVRIHGYCASACTLILLREFTGIKACAVDEQVVFAFHKPFEIHGNKIVKSKKLIRTTRAIWADMLAHFPYDVYRLLKDARIPSATEGDSPDDMFVVPAIFFLPKCEAAK